MTQAIAGLIVAFAVGALRAMELRRIGSRVNVINVVVVSAFAERRSSQIGELMGKSGPSVYLRVASAIAESAQQFLLDHPNSTGARHRDALVEHLERDARAALIVATRRLRKYSWLDTATILGLGYAGIQLAIRGEASAMIALGMIAGTLLWLSNVVGVRHIAQRFAVGAAALIQSLSLTLETLRVSESSEPGSE